jgi:hypothetical protein
MASPIDALVRVQALFRGYRQRGQSRFSCALSLLLHNDTAHIASAIPPKRHITHSSCVRSVAAGPVCLGPATTTIKAWPAGCGHKFCDACATRWLELSRSCPMCRAKVVSDKTRIKRAIIQVNLDIMQGLAPLVLDIG